MSDKGAAYLQSITFKDLCKHCIHSFIKGMAINGHIFWFMTTYFFTLKHQNINEFYIIFLINMP